MKPIFLLILIATAIQAQDAIDRGAQIFRTTCAQGYCHGAGGTQGRAPKLIGRVYDAPIAAKIISDGVPNTGMPAFKDRLNGAELNAVIAYVVKISGGDPSKLPAVAASAGAKQMSPQAKQGREAFFDAIRGVDRCGTCHAIDGLGIAVGPNLISGTKYTAAQLREGKQSSIRLATVAGDSFPALVVERNATTLRVYDLSVKPPPLRTFAPSAVTLGPGATWQHADAVKNYTGADLDMIAAWLASLQ